MNRVPTDLRCLATCLALCGLILQGCATADLDTTPPVQSYHAISKGLSALTGALDNRLKIVTLNIAHGRGEGFHQLLQRPAITRTNLDTIAALLKNTGADVIALQEADGPSFWSGNFDHVGYIADKATLRESVHGVHANRMGLSYGTALMTNLGLSNPKAVTFDPAVTPVPKGFVISTINWPGNPSIEVDVVSIHLDFASKSIRQKQAMELIATVKDRKRPVVIMGDFNAEWHEDSIVQRISRALSLSAYNPGESGLETFPTLGKRLDWILVSPGIEFRSYQVIPETVSDHLGVVAELEWAGQYPASTNTDTDR